MKKDPSTTKVACPATITSLPLAFDSIHVTFQLLCVFTGKSDGSVERNLGEWSLHLDITASTKQNHMQVQRTSLIVPEVTLHSTLVKG